MQNDKNVISILNGNGDFRSDECVELLKEADVVVTNPPFSLFREFVALMMKYQKPFLVIGSQNNITYKDVFKYLRNNELWLGYKSGDMAFRVPDYFEPRATRYWVDEQGQKWRSMGNICWFTNLDIQKRHEDLDLYRYYTPEEYPLYDNCDAINVAKVSEIPMDYEGAMGVPVTFLDKYNPDQFEILGLTQIGCHDAVPDTKKYNDYKEMLRSTDEPTGSGGGKTNENAVLKGKGSKKTYYLGPNGELVHSEYKRLFIRKKQN